MAYTTWFNPKTGKFETIQLNDNLPKLEVDDEGKVPGTSGGGGFYVGDTPPEDTNLIWIDTSDDSFDLLVDADTIEFPRGEEE